VTELPWGLSQIRELVRFKHAQRTTKRRARRLLDRGRLAEYLDRPCPYCGILMTDWNGRNDWRAPGPRSQDPAIARRSQRLREHRQSPVQSEQLEVLVSQFPHFSFAPQGLRCQCPQGKGTRVADASDHLELSPLESAN
jgi:hypothetical protein